MLPEHSVDVRLWLTGTVDMGEMFWLVVKRSITPPRICRPNVSEQILESHQIACHGILNVIPYGTFTNPFEAQCVAHTSWDLQAEWMGGVRDHPGGAAPPFQPGGQRSRLPRGRVQIGG